MLVFFPTKGCFLVYIRELFVWDICREATTLTEVIVVSFSPSK
jgi:hypothetical protein